MVILALVLGAPAAAEERLVPHGGGADGSVAEDALGTPLTGAEMAALRRAVSGCWLVESDRPAVTVAVRMTPEGAPIADTIRLIDHDGPPEAAEPAFQAARRAILRCGDRLPLPPEKHRHWAEIEMTFDPAAPFDP